MSEIFSINVEFTKEEFECIIEALATMRARPDTPVKKTEIIQQIYNKLLDSQLR